METYAANMLAGSAFPALCLLKSRYLNMLHIFSILIAKATKPTKTMIQMQGSGLPKQHFFKRIVRIIVLEPIFICSD